MQGQFLYLGRWVDKKTFRAFVYNGKEQKLANNYDEFEDLVCSGLWFETKELALEAQKELKKKKKEEKNSNDKSE